MSHSHMPCVTPKGIPNGAFLLDVREHNEWVAGHAPSAVHVPMSDIPARMHEVPRDGDVVVICRSGYRSARVVEYMLGNGWTTIYNLEGGMQAWEADGRPVVQPNGQPGAII